MIGVEAARESYAREDISNVGRIPSEDKPAEGLTKKGRCETLETFLDTGRLDVPIQKWVVRSPMTDTLRLPLLEKLECRE